MGDDSNSSFSDTPTSDSQSFGFDGYSNAPPTSNNDLFGGGGDASAGNTNMSGANTNFGLQDMYSMNQALEDNALGANNMWDNAGYQVPEVDYDAMDWLQGAYKKYSNYINPLLGFAARTNPYVAAGMGLYNAFNNPKGTVGSMVGSALGSTLGGAVGGGWGAAAGNVAGGMFGGRQAASSTADGGGGQSGSSTGAHNNNSGFSIGSTLGGAFLGQRAANDFKNQANALQDLYSPNSAYAQQMRQSLARTDAAKGRRSQQGTREVELQARLADLNSRNASQIQSLTKDRRMAQLSTIKDLAYMGNEMGLY